MRHSLVCLVRPLALEHLTKQGFSVTIPSHVKGYRAACSRT